MRSEALVRSLELVAERGDPAPAVYVRLFAAHPAMEALFCRDKNGSIRGNMLTEAITALIDFADANTYGGNLFRAEIVNHEHLSVPPANFVAFFGVMHETFAEMLGDEWTPEFDAAWREVLARVADALRT